jgi:hypothetical protein
MLRTSPTLLSRRCQRTRHFATSRGLLGKGLRCIEEGDLVALVSGVDIPIIVRKEGNLYGAKDLAYVHEIIIGEKWPEDEKYLINMILS